MSVDPEAQAAWCPPEEESSTPQDRRQLVNHNVKNAICQLGMRPLILTGALRHVLIHLFSTPTQIEEPDLRSNIWKPGQDTSILIESVNRWKGDLVELRPAILLKRNAMRNVRYGIADRIATTIDGFDAYNTFWVGSHTIFCIGETSASAELLATEVQRGLLQFGPAISKQLDLVKFHITEVGAAAEIEESTENFVVPISLGWCYQELWELTQESMKLAAVALDFDPTVGTC